MNPDLGPLGHATCMFRTLPPPNMNMHRQWLYSFGAGTCCSSLLFFLWEDKCVFILWMDELLHHLRNPGMIPCKYQQIMASTKVSIWCEMDFVHQKGYPFGECSPTRRVRPCGARSRTWPSHEAWPGVRNLGQRLVRRDQYPHT